MIQEEGQAAGRGTGGGVCERGGSQGYTEGPEPLRKPAVREKKNASLFCECGRNGTSRLCVMNK